MLEFHLARTLGMTVSELRHRMPAAEFAEWAAFLRWEGEEAEKAAKAAERKAARG